MNAHTNSNLFADLDYNIGDAVAVLPDVRGGHRQGGDRAVAGVVTNRRKDNCVFQYLVDVVDGGRNWYDAKCVVDVEQTGIYAHVANDGLNFCSYDADYAVIEELETPTDTMFSTLEYVEGQMYGTDGADEFLDDLPSEVERLVEDIDAPGVGTLYYRDSKVVAVDIEIPGE